jgi:tetratricopeptide (TPR) repeat protein
VPQLCESLADRDLIRLVDRDRFAFRHILIQEVAYSTLPRSERARMHAEAARWVKASSEGREVAVAEILAFHYREAAVLSAALDPGSEGAAATRESAGLWLLRAADVAAAAGATPEAVRHIRASFDFVDPAMLPRLHERIGDLTAGDSGLEEYREALELYVSAGAPVDDQLRALSGMLMVATRWQGSVGGRPSEGWMDNLRARGRRLLEEAKDARAIGRFLAAYAFYPFWLEVLRKPTDEMIAEAAESARRAVEIAEEMGDADLASTALDALGAISTSAYDWVDALATSRRRLEFEDRLGFYERLDAHSMVSWMSFIMGDLAGAEKDSAAMIARVLPGQAPYPALHLFAWRTLTLMMLGRWDESVTAFWRAIEAWNDAGRHAAGYGLRGFVAGFDIARARGDARIQSAASEAITSIVSRFDTAHLHQQLLSYIQGDAALAEESPVLRSAYPSELTERRVSLACDNRNRLPQSLLEDGLAAAVAKHQPLLEAQLQRALGLASRDPARFSAALETWERSGALPSIGRARAERGLVAGDAAEAEAGLAILRKLGDTYYLDRFTALS